jgi:hypothetical protein
MAEKTIVTLDIGADIVLEIGSDDENALVLDDGKVQVRIPIHYELQTPDDPSYFVYLALRRLGRRIDEQGDELRSRLVMAGHYEYGPFNGPGAGPLR